MSILRNDAWKPEDDKVLAETVLTHIKNKSTQLVAFEEVAEKLGRTAAACGFRWNSDVRRRYEKEIAKAKEIRNSINHKSSNQKSSSESDEKLTVELNADPLDTIMSQIMQYKKIVKDMENKIGALKREIIKRDATIEDLNAKLEETKSPKEKISEDYNNLLLILNRARELGALDKVAN